MPPQLSVHGEEGLAAPQVLRVCTEDVLSSMCPDQTDRALGVLQRGPPVRETLNGGTRWNLRQRTATGISAAVSARPENAAKIRWLQYG